MKSKEFAVTALLAALVCVLSPWAIPTGAVPLTLASFGVYLCGGLAGFRKGTAAVAVYLLLGGLGVPVFSGFSGGWHRLVGPTGGFLLGFLVCAAAIGLSRPLWQGSRLKCALWLGIATLALYAMGTLWYCLQTGSSFWSGLGLCVLPVLPGDGAKIGVAALLLPSLNRRLSSVK